MNILYPHGKDLPTVISISALSKLYSAATVDAIAGDQIWWSKTHEARNPIRRKLGGLVPPELHL